MTEQDRIQIQIINLLQKLPTTTPGEEVAQWVLGAVPQMLKRARIAEVVARHIEGDFVYTGICEEQIKKIWEKEVVSSDG